MNSIKTNLTAAISASGFSRKELLQIVNEVFVSAPDTGICRFCSSETHIKFYPNVAFNIASCRACLSYFLEFDFKVKEPRSKSKKIIFVEGMILDSF
mgnify:CR=1 FL=1